MRRTFVTFFAVVIFCSILFTSLASAASITTVKQPNDVSATWVDRSTIKVTATAPSGTVKDYVYSDTNLDNNWNFRAPSTCTYTIPGSSVTDNHNSLGISDSGDKTHAMESGGQSNLFDYDNFTQFNGNNAFLVLFQLDNGDAQTGGACILKYGALSVDQNTPSNSSVYGARVSVGNVENKKINFYFSSGGASVGRVDKSGDWNFTLCDPKTKPQCQDLLTKYKTSSIWLKGGDGDGCQDPLILDGTWGSGLPSGRILQQAGNDCHKSGNNIDVFMGNNKDEPPPVNSQVGQTIKDGETQKASCETAGGGALSWIACPIIELLDSATNWLDSQIQNLLITPNPNDASTGIEGGGLHQAWGQVRNIALLILIPIMLVMVIGTAIGVSFLDAYTVRRAMPRFLIAILFISTSWYITSFMITITNVVGTGILGLMTVPFGAAQQSLADLVGSGLGIATTVGAPIFVGLAILGGGLSFAIIGSFALVTVLALVTAFVVLTMRQLILLVLVVFAPLAILSWIFPNNDKLWKLWWDSFFKLLLMFPLIMILIGAGKDFALIIDKTNIYSGVDNIVKELMVVAAYVLPYFFIPFTFKAAGGLFSTLTGMVNDRSRGVFDRQKKKRAETRTANRERASGNNRFNPNNRFVKKFKLNDLGSMAASPGSNLAYYGRNLPGLSGKGQKILSQIESAQISQSSKLFEELNSHGFNDKAYRVLSGAHSGLKGKNRLANGATQMMGEDGQMRDVTTADALREAGLYGKAPGTIKDFQSMAGILSHSDSDTETIAANVLEGSAGRLASLYSDPEMGKASVQAAGMIGLSAHGFASGEDIATVGNSMMDNGMSAEAAQALVSTAQVAGQRQRPDVKAGYGTVVEHDANGKVRFESGTKAGGKRARDLIKTLSAQDLASAKSGSLKELTPTINDVLADGSGEVAARVRAGQGTEQDSQLYGEAQAMKEQLFSWAGPYSQASVDAKRQSLEIIDKQSGGRKPQTRQVRNRDNTVTTEEYVGYDQGTIGWEFEQRQRAETDPTRRGESGGGGEEAAGE